MQKSFIVKAILIHFTYYRFLENEFKYYILVFSIITICVPCTYFTISRLSDLNTHLPIFPVPITQLLLLIKKYN